MIDSFIGPEDDYIFTSGSGAHETTYHGEFAGLSMLRTIRDLCTKVAKLAKPPAELSGEAIAEAFDTSSTDPSSYNRVASLALLPSRERLNTMVSIALNHVMNAQHCIDRTKLDAQLQRLYDRDPENYTRADRRSLGLVYALMALGRRHDPDADKDSQQAGDDVVILKG